MFVSRGIVVALFVLLATSRAWALEPSKAECIAANEAAQDLRSAGKLRDARTKLAFCMASTCPGPVREDCAQRLSEVDAVMPSIVFEAKDDSGNDLIAVHVKIDGLPLVDKLDGTAVPVDLGRHRFGFDAEGMAGTEKILVVHEGDKGRHERVVLGGVRSSSPPAAPFPSSTVSAAPPATRSPGMPTAAYVAFGVGAVGLAVGSAFGVAALSDKSTLDSGPCPTATTCRSGTDLDSLHSHEIAANIGFGVGLVGAVAGVVFWLLRPTASESGHAHNPGRSVESLIGANGVGLGGRL
jgi:hypothetical protein